MLAFARNGAILAIFALNNLSPLKLGSYILTYDINSDYSFAVAFLILALTLIFLPEDWDRLSFPKSARSIGEETQLTVSEQRPAPKKEDVPTSEVSWRKRISQRYSKARKKIPGWVQYAVVVVAILTFAAI